MTPKVSIVIPVRDAREDLPRLLAALAALDWPGHALETIVVDDGSTDGTSAILAGERLTLIREPESRGPYAARNRGARAATGEWITFTDGDCAPRPDWLRRLFADPVEDGVGALVGEVLALETATPVQRFIESRGFMRHAVTLPHKALPCFSTANVAVRRDLLLSLGGFREDVRFFGDMDLSWRMQLTRGATLSFRPDAVVLHRHRRSVSGLWKQAVQHGQGVAFMRRSHPDVYRIDGREQLRRLGGLGAAAAAALSPGADAWRTPGYLALWYGGLAWGYVKGPAWTIRA
ncbi:MAG TPA: glycosyltransferase [Candidatus Polarisedimenticolaceae bacterium]|nr:glycosyltransferase [Candidatus Polarisedimenticolaceae bacterium]